MMLFAMANAGLPATRGFVGEFMVILAAVKVNFWLGFLAATTLILGAAYTLWMYKRVIFGDVANAHVAALTDLNRREFWLLGDARGRGARHGRLSEAVHRRDARVGRRPARARRAKQALTRHADLNLAAGAARDRPPDGGLR